MTVFLFDIDGTLLTCGGAGRRSMLQAHSSYFAEHGCNVAASTALDFQFGGMTDRAIIRQALEAARVAVDEAIIDEVLARYLSALEIELAAKPSGYRVFDGVFSLLDQLEQLSHVVCGLGTGNVIRGADIKLTPLGLRQRFAFGGFGSDHEDRPTLLGIGKARGLKRVGRSDVRTIIVGDTPRDVHAAHAIGAECLAVATGAFDRDTLEKQKPALVVDRLDDARAFAFLSRA